MERLAVAAALREIGHLLTAGGADVHRARAYERGARALESVDDTLANLVLDRRLTLVPGIGERLAAVITELHRTGRSSVLDQLRTSLPPGVVELRRVPGLGLTRIRALHRAGINSIAELRASAESGRLREVPGFGERAAAGVLGALDRVRPDSPRGLRLDEAHRLADLLVAHLGSAPDGIRAEPVGELRRGIELTHEIELVAATAKPAAAFARLQSFPLVAAAEDLDERSARVRLVDGVPVTLHTVPDRAFAAAVHHHTGSAAHVARLQEIARERGLVLDEHGLRATTGGRRVAVADELTLYEALGLPAIPPELREDEGEIEAALAGTLPDDLVTTGDIRGLVHCHTTYSDGGDTIEAMAQAADALGMDYLTITDHSPEAHYAGGLTVDRLKTQWEEIARVQERVRVRLLRGTECDILRDGALDYPDAILESLDVVIASVHGRHRMDGGQMTQRLLRAMAHPVFKIWGHARGRLIPSRPPFDCDMDAVLDGLARARGAVEVNGDPRRLDLDPRWLRAARERGIPFVVSTDAHSAGALANLRYGVTIARRGWIRRGEVLNTLGPDAFAAAVHP